MTTTGGGRLDVAAEHGLVIDKVIIAVVNIHLARPSDFPRSTPLLLGWRWRRHLDLALRAT